MAFTNFYLTNKGATLLAKAQAGTAINFTKAQIGDGTVPDGTNIVTTTALYNTVQTLSLAGITTSSQQAQIKVQFTNASVTTAFSWREIGIFATDPDEGEILYVYANAGDSPVPIDAYGTQSIEFLFNVIVKIANAAATTATISSGLIFATESDITDGTVIAGKAAKLATARTISLTGDAAGSASFDGSADTPMTVTVADDSHKHTVSTVTDFADNVSNPNLLINGDFEVCQRKVTSSTDAGYSTVDRWYSAIWDNDSTPVLPSVTCSRLQDTDSGNKYYMRLYVSSIGGSTSGQNFWQILEDTVGDRSDLAGKTVTFSATVFSTNDARCLYISCYTKVNGVDTWKLIGATPIPANTKGRYSLTVTLPDDATRIEIGIGVTRSLTSADVKTYTDFYDAKLEIGSVATSFVPRPYAEELELCQRYYQVLPIRYYAVGASESDGIHIGINLAVPMRTTPTLIGSTMITQIAGTGGNNYYSDASISFKWGSLGAVNILMVNPDSSKFPCDYPVTARIDTPLGFDAEIY